MEGGWRVFDVWESQEALDTFFREKLGEALQNAGMPDVQPEVFEVYNMMSS
jgi:quinol monooxygenase YgiN